jgi:hypothetical protein
VDLERTLGQLDEAVDFSKGYRFELTDEYVALIARVEAMVRNQSGADKGSSWLGGRLEVLAGRAIRCLSTT